MWEVAAALLRTCVAITHLFLRPAHEVRHLLARDGRGFGHCRCTDYFPTGGRYLDDGVHWLSATTSMWAGGHHEKIKYFMLVGWFWERIGKLGGNCFLKIDFVPNTLGDILKVLLPNIRLLQKY